MREQNAESRDCATVWSFKIVCCVHIVEKLSWEDCVKI